MGGDGGVVATNRRYMRGAGTADHTGDSARRKETTTTSASEIMTTCALTKKNLDFNQDSIVVCPWGRLYLKEAAIQALIRKKQHAKEASFKDELPHIRKRSGLLDLRAHVESSNSSTVLTCPITSKPLQGKLPGVLIVPGKADKPNVISVAGMKLLSKEELAAEYGSIERKIRLAPPPDELQALREKWKESMAERQRQKEQKKQMKSRTEHTQHSKRKLNSNEDQVAKKQSKTSVGVEARSKVQATLQSNSVLSSLFVDGTGEEKGNAVRGLARTKEEKDRLFAR